MRDRFGPESIEAVLRRRGFEPIAAAPADKLVIAGNLIEADRVIPLPQISAFRARLAHSSFRKLLRRLTAAHGSPVPISTLLSITADADADLELLASLGAILRDGESVSFLSSVNNIGPTLEWCVAELCELDLRGSAQWGVQLQGLASGGDYDVLAWLAPLLIYVELKSGRPGEVPVEQLTAFLRRSEDLAPDMAILLIDSADPLEGLLHRLSEASIGVQQHGGIQVLDGWQVGEPLFLRQEGFPGVFWRDGTCLYVTGSEPSILTQLRRCLVHQNTKVRGGRIDP